MLVLAGMVHMLKYAPMGRAPLLFIVRRVDDLPQIKLIERILAVDVEVAILD